MSEATFLLACGIMARGPRKLKVKFGSTSLTHYGHQEQARIGDNPSNRGRPSYHPLLCFEGQSKDSPALPRSPLASDR